MSVDYERLARVLLDLPEAQRAVLLPVVVGLLQGEAPEVALPPAVAQLMMGFRRSLGVADDASTEQILAAVDGRLQQAGITAATLREILLDVRDPASLSADMARLVGASPPGAVIQQEPPPEGSVASGPMARHLLGKDYK